MQIKETQIKKYTLSDLEDMPPVTIILEDYEDKRGEITIKTEDYTVSYYWGSMGSDLRRFLVKLNFDYLIDKLFYERKSIDRKATENNNLGEIIRLRRDRDISRDEAREAYDFFKHNCMYSSVDSYYTSLHGHSFICEWFNDFECFPVVRDYPYQVYSFWEYAWLPFIEYLCKEELKIEYKRPYSPEWKK